MMAGVWMALGAVLTLGIVLAIGRMVGFAAPGADAYADMPGEPLDMRRHLNGPMEIHGVIYGPVGRVVSRFSGEIEGIWQGNSGVLRERFRYASGKEEAREWRLWLGNDQSIRAEADDVPGGARGHMAGPAVQMRYRLKLAPEAGGHVLNAVDWMYLAPDGAVVNRSQFRKFGFKVAELVAVMRPKEAT